MLTTKKILQGNVRPHEITIPTVVPADSYRKEFVCPEESMRYAGSLEQLVFSKFRNSHSSPTIIEFGSGTGEPVISAILKSKFFGTVYGYEINPEASETADQLIEEHGLAKRYIVQNTSFFESQRIPQSNYLIANPPYLPCEDRDALILPDLCGGKEGNDVSKRLLSYEYQNIFIEISSYSNPAAVIKHALSLGYKMPDFLITQMPFGIYSRQEIVQKRIRSMKKVGKAFFTENCYLVGSAFFTKKNDVRDLSLELLKCLTALG